MTVLLFNILLAICFALLTGLSVTNLLLGLVLSFLILAFLPVLPTRGLGFPDIKTGKNLLVITRNLFLFFVDFLWDLTVSNVQIAWDIWTPADHYTPRLVEVFVGDLSPMQLTLLSSRITLTPGTLTAEVSEDRRILIVHVMYPGKDDIAKRLRQPIDILKKGLDT